MINSLKKLLKKIPVVQKSLKTKHHRSQFKTELGLLNKTLNTKSNSLPSILHFSLNKSATQHVKNILLAIAAPKNFIHAGLNEYAYASDLPYLDDLSFTEMKQYNHVFKKTGFVYSVFGGMIENIENLNNYKVVLSIRDPRDILVSSYFHILYSQQLPPDSGDKKSRFLKRRNEIKNLSIDDFVLQESELVLSIYDKYDTYLLQQHPNVGIVKYEDMVTHYELWLTDLANKTGLPLSTELKEQLVTEYNDNRIKKENKHAHNRKGIVGDFKEKLQPSTIDKLNIIYKDVLRAYDYQLN